MGERGRVLDDQVWRIRSHPAAAALFERPRVDTARPRELGIHSAIPGAHGDDDLPAYVERDFDFRLRAVLTADLPDRGSFVILVGGSSSGKTRSLYEAVYASVPDWSLAQPAAASDLLTLRTAPPARTVFWLDELQQYLGGSPALSAECVRVLVRHGNLVVGTLWPDQYAKWTSAPGDVQRLMKSAATISVPDALTAAELAQAEEIARRDSRIRSALRTRDAGLTQVLAGGPSLVMCWEQPATPYAKAIITAAADAHRLGVQAPLGADLLLAAMFDYLRRDKRVLDREQWLPRALPHATRPLHGDVSALSPVDDGRAGTLAGYALADYLAQHLRRLRRTTPVPRSAWLALGEHLRRAEDLRRVAAAALARLRYDHAAPVLARLAYEFDDGRAAAELADLLVRQNRFAAAFDVLGHRLEADPQDRLLAGKLTRVQQLDRRVADIRAGADAPAAVRRALIADLLADGGVCDDLRALADAGDRRAAEQLVERLADRGCLRELRDRADQGDRFAAESFADILLAWGEVDLLRERAVTGDRAAELRLAKAVREPGRPAGAEREMAELRAAVDQGRPEAAVHLCTLLFELRDEESLRAELEAGTAGAAERLITLYTANEHRDLIDLRAFGLDAAGDTIHPGTDFTTAR